MPNPQRTAIVSPVSGVTLFQTPNNVTTNLNADLQSMLITELGKNSPFAAFQPSSGTSSGENPCAPYIMVTASVLNFTLDDVTLGVTFGFNAGTAIPVVSGLGATATGTINIGSIQMGFGVWVCTPGSTENAATGGCTLALSSTSDQTALGGNLSFTINYSMITASASLMALTNLGSMVDTIMVAGIKSLASQDLSVLPWQSTIVAMGSGTAAGLGILAGQSQGLAAGNSFVVYLPSASSSASGGCPVNTPVACVHATSVFDSTSYTVDSLTTFGQSAGIQVGDVVGITKSCGAQ